METEKKKPHLKEKNQNPLQKYNDTDAPSVNSII